MWIALALLIIGLLVVSYIYYKQKSLITKKIKQLHKENGEEFLDIKNK